MIPPADAMGYSTMTVKEAITILMLSLGSGMGIFFLLLKYIPHSNFFNRSGIITNASI